MGTIVAVVCLVLCIMLNVDKYIKEIQWDLEKKHA